MLDGGLDAAICWRAEAKSFWSENMLVTADLGHRQGGPGRVVLDWVVSQRIGGANKIVVGRYDSRVLKYSGAKMSLGVSDERGCDASVGEDEEKREKKVEEDKLCDARYGEAGCGRAEPRSRRGTLGLGGCVTPDRWRGEWRRPREARPGCDTQDTACEP